MGSRCTGGYGQMKVNGRLVMTHRLAFEEANGFSPDNCRHKCDNPPCINPDHLEDGTVADNMRDMVSRGRSMRVHGDGVINEVRELRERGLKYREISDATGVSMAHISRILNGQARNT